MTFTEFYCNPSTGSNVNGGSDTGSPSMSDTAGTGSWNSATNVYITVATTGTVTVGQFLSIYSGAATVAAYTARITTVTGGSGSAWHITLSATAFSGVSPTTGATFKAQCGGAWKGPNAAVGFPFNYITNALTDAGGDPPRVNFKNNATYSITAGMTQTNAGPLYFQGMTTSPGDLGKATIDGGTSGAVYSLLSTNSNLNYLRDLIFQHNGATGTVTSMVVLTGAGSNTNTAERCVFSNSVTGFLNCGISTGQIVRLIECEAFSNGDAGILNNGTSLYCIRCVSHDNTGAGFAHNGTETVLVDCVADTNGAAGITTSSGSSEIDLENFTAYNNTTAGVLIGNNTCSVFVENGTLANNSTYGVSVTGTGCTVRLSNNAYYSNGTAATNGVVDETGAITCSVQPMNDPANGDFTLNNTATGGASVRNAGRGKFTQNAGSYTKTTTAFPDGGAVQHQDAGGTSGPIIVGG